LKAKVAPASDEKLMRFGDVVVQLNTALSDTPSVFIGLHDQTHGLWDPGKPFAVGEWHYLSLLRSSESLSFSIDGVPQGTAIPCDTFGDCSKTGRTGTSHAGVEAEVRVLRPPSGPALTDVSELWFDPKPPPRLPTGSPANLLRSTKELELYGGRALPLIYAATSVAIRSGMDDSQGLLSAANSVSADKAPVVLSDASFDGMNVDRQATNWAIEESRVHFHGTITAHGRTVLVFLQSFDGRWQLRLAGRPIENNRHVLADGFANAWIIEGVGSVRWDLEYGPQAAVNVGYGVGGALLVISALFLSLRGLFLVFRRIKRSLRPGPKIGSNTSGGTSVREGVVVGLRHAQSADSESVRPRGQGPSGAS
jgi:hypothetical protein